MLNNTYSSKKEKTLFKRHPRIWSTKNQNSMSRFLVVSSSDYEDEPIEEEEEQKEQEAQPEPAAPVKGSTSRFFEDDNIVKKRKFVSEKMKTWIKFRDSLDKILNAIALNDFKEAYKNFQELQKSYLDSEKVIAENGNPDFFIRQMSEIVDFVQENSKNKELRRFSQDLNNFIKPFADILEDYKSNPDDFQDDDFESMDDEDEEEEVVEVKEEKNKGWFYSGSSDEDEEIIQNVKSEEPQKVKQPKKEAQMSIEERLKNSVKVITIDTVKNELPTIIKKRQSGKVSTTPQYLNDMYHVVAEVDKTLAHQIAMEICHTVAAYQSSSPIPLGDWELVLQFLPGLKEESKGLISLLERLNKDFWARSIDPRHLFTEEVAKLHQNVPKFIQILKVFADYLDQNGEKNYAAQIDLIILEHLYHKESEDVYKLALYVIEATSNPDAFLPEVSLNMKAHAAFYLCINLALRKYPQEAAALYERVPTIPDTLPLAQILANRARAYIGIAAFKQNYYLIAYKYLCNFNNLKYIAGNIGQMPSIYPPWLIIEPNYLYLLGYLSAIILDLPYLTVTNNEFLLIDPALHRELQREPVVFHPETTVQQIALTIHKAKVGDWKSAYESIKKELTKYYPEHNSFIETLKIISLCCFLLTANQFYDNISVDYLSKKFDLKKEKIIEIVKGIIEGKGPIEDIKLTLKGKLIENEQFILFEHTETESPLVSYGEMIGYKTDVINEKLNEEKTNK